MTLISMGRNLGDTAEAAGTRGTQAWDDQEGCTKAERAASSHL